MVTSFKQKLIANLFTGKDNSLDNSESISPGNFVVSCRFPVVLLRSIGNLDKAFMKLRNLGYHCETLCSALRSDEFSARI
jgi:hypothetical protein